MVGQDASARSTKFGQDVSAPKSTLGYGAPAPNHSWVQSQADPIPLGFSVWVEPNYFQVQYIAKR